MLRYLILPLATLALVAYLLVSGGNDSALQRSVDIYGCVIETLYEDGSARTADAESAEACMSRAKVLDAFRSDYR